MLSILSYSGVHNQYSLIINLNKRYFSEDSSCPHVEKLINITHCNSTKQFKKQFCYDLQSALSDKNDLMNKIDKTGWGCRFYNRLDKDIQESCANMLDTTCYIDNYIICILELNRYRQIPINFKCACYIYYMLITKTIHYQKNLNVKHIWSVTVFHI